MVSIHALLAECDSFRLHNHRSYMRFNPRTPCGVRLYPSGEVETITEVSIHALLAECDGEHNRKNNTMKGFNPRTPCGVRLGVLFFALKGWKFQSTHSLRSATNNLVFQLCQSGVSIHALLAECDQPGKSIITTDNGFNPRTPCGVRQEKKNFLGDIVRFQSTHSLRSATSHAIPHNSCYRVSIHALLAECD